MTLKHGSKEKSDKNQGIVISKLTVEELTKFVLNQNLARSLKTLAHDIAKIGANNRKAYDRSTKSFLSEYSLATEKEKMIILDLNGLTM